MKETGDKPLLDVNIWVEDDMLRIDVTDNGCGVSGTVGKKRKLCCQYGNRIENSEQYHRNA